jgi:hypothetical protein
MVPNFAVGGLALTVRMERDAREAPTGVERIHIGVCVPMARIWVSVMLAGYASTKPSTGIAGGQCCF